MTQCPNCGGGVRFDIATQKIKCDYCSSQFEPYDDNFGNMAEAQEDFDVVVYTCRNCGGEIVSTAETGAAFCSYCGSSTLLEGRFSKEKKPELIIPFKLTKEGCKSAFAKRLSKAIFAPGAYKKSAQVDGFRGIYMPYWVYDMSQEGPIMVKTSKSHRKGDYIITDHYEMTGMMDNAYDGVSYDASSSFADDISSAIAPYNVKDIKYFSPSFLAGFYADIADVPDQIYEGTAKDLAKESTYNYLRKSSPMAGNNFDEGKEKVKNKISTRIYAKHSAMFPVWFLSYRSRDRVAYATVNGQTGRVSADMPVSIPRYFACTAILAAVIFVLLQLFLTLTPDVLLISIAVLSLISAILYKVEMKKIVAKEQYEDDRGMLSMFERKRQTRIEAQKGASFNDVGGEAEPYVLTDNDIKRNEKKEKKSKPGLIVVIVLAVMFGGPALMALLGGMTAALSVDKICGIVALVTLAIAVPLTISSSKNIKQMKGKKGLPGTLWTCIGLFVIAAVSFWDPPQDAIYYGTAILAMVCVIVNAIDLMVSYNYIAMRPLPQFETHTGGDDRA